MLSNALCNYWLWALYCIMLSRAHESLDFDFLSKNKANLQVNFFLEKLLLAYTKSEIFFRYYIVYILHLDDLIQFFFHLNDYFWEAWNDPIWMILAIFTVSMFFQIFNSISIGGNLWMKGVFSKPSGDYIVAPIFCLLS